MHVSQVWRCVSMNPGMTMSPAASMTRAPSAVRPADVDDLVVLDEHVGARQLAELSSWVSTIRRG